MPVPSTSNVFCSMLPVSQKQLDILQLMDRRNNVLNEARIERILEEKGRYLRRPIRTGGRIRNAPPIPSPGIGFRIKGEKMKGGALAVGFIHGTANFTRLNPSGARYQNRKIAGVKGHVYYENTIPLHSIPVNLASDREGPYFYVGNNEMKFRYTLGFTHSRNAAKRRARVYARHQMMNI